MEALTMRFLHNVRPALVLLAVALAVVVSGRVPTASAQYYQYSNCGNNPYYPSDVCYNPNSCYLTGGYCGYTSGPQRSTGSYSYPYYYGSYAYPSYTYSYPSWYGYPYYSGSYGYSYLYPSYLYPSYFGSYSYPGYYYYGY